MNKPTDRPVRPAGVPDRWDHEDVRRTVEAPGDPGDCMSFPYCWVWSPPEEDWVIAHLRTWYLTGTGWWAAVHVGSSFEHVHQWSLRPMDPHALGATRR